MGTTLVTAVIYNEDMYVANVGDSRCYILREDDLKRITVDHSVVEDLVRMNIISRHCAGTENNRCAWEHPVVPFPCNDAYSRYRGWDTAF